MVKKFIGKVEILDSAKNATITLDGNTANVSGGGSGKDGEIRLRDGAGKTRILLDGKNGNMYVRDDAQKNLLFFRGDISDVARLMTGGAGGDGQVIVRNKANNVKFIANPASMFVLRKVGNTQRQMLYFDASPTKNWARLFLGSKGNVGHIIVRDKAGANVFHLDGNAAALHIGAKGNEGDIMVRNNAGDITFHVDGNEGDISVYRKIGGTNREVMRFDASHAALYIGSQKNEGDIIVRDGGGRDVFHFDSSYAALYVGAAGNEGDIIVRDGAGNERIRLDGHTGDIRLQGADCAEQFDVTEMEKVDPGTVLVIDDESKLRPCNEPYDKKVAGVASGGNGSNPGIILDDNPTQDMRLPVALSGKVYCKVDAEISPVEVGDLLTTSSTPGHAMKADDPSKAFGAVIGKALRPLREGKGLIPILVALQ